MDYTAAPQAPFAAALYIVTSFLLTTFLGLSVTRKLRGQEAMYACAAISLGISLFLFLSHNVVPYIYQEQHLAVWGIGQALLNDPKLVILDEPTAGLDPKELVRFKNLIEQLGKDSIVLLSTC